MHNAFHLELPQAKNNNKNILAIPPPMLFFDQNLGMPCDIK